MSCFLLLFLLALPAVAAEPPAEAAWRVWLEPKFWRAPVTQPIPGADRVELAAGLLGPDGLQHLPKADFEALQRPWPEFFARASANAEADLAALTVRYERNRQRIILYAELRAPADNPSAVATAVLAPGFLANFERTLAPNFLVVVPSRSHAFLFPKLASPYQNFAPLVLETYRAATEKVSLELFETTSTGLKAIGRFANPGE